MYPRRGYNNYDIYTLHIGAPKYIKQMLIDIRAEINSNTIIVEDFNTPVTPMGRSSRQKTNKEITASHAALDQVDLIDTYSAFPPNCGLHIFSSA